MRSLFAYIDSKVSMKILISSYMVDIKIKYKVNSKQQNLHDEINVVMYQNSWNKIKTKHLYNSHDFIILVNLYIPI